MAASFNDNAKVVVTGCGLVCSLGLDVANVCAAARAGIQRATSMDVYPVRSEADGVAAGVVCHAVPFLTDGFEGDSRLARLAQGGLEDLMAQCPDQPWRTRVTAFYLSLPSALRLVRSADLVANEDARKEMLEAEKEAGEPGIDLERARGLLAQGARWAQWLGEPDLKWCTESGNTGVAEAIVRASADLQRSNCDAAIVGGVDSYLDEDTLGWLENTCRLKTPDMASGLPPGEAGGFLLLERAGDATTRGARVLASIDDVLFRDESRKLSAGEPSTGIALAQLIHAVAEKARRENEPELWIIHDMNGEAYRAHEWGIALFRLASMSDGLPRLIPHFPAASMGDVGAATGVAQVCTVINATQRRYSPRHRAVLTAASDGVTRSCVCLSTGTLPPAHYGS
jgi:3-oxoacyl-[acyl-carrier-protein] synthase-1